MAVDLATIGIEFQTSGLVKGRTELDRTAASANKAADAVERTGRSVEKTDKGVAKFTETLDRTGKTAVTADRSVSGIIGTLDRTTASAKKSADAVSNTGKSAELASRGFSSWAITLKGLALGVIVTQTIRTADALNNVNSRLSLVTKSTGELTQVQQQLFQLSQQNRSDFAATADLYTALARSTKELGTTQEQLLRITGTFGKAIIISGGSATSAAAAITQFNQAMASGVLRGEEFNSVSEQAPRIMDLLASSLGKTRGELRQLAQDGKLTSDVVLPAILKGAKDVEAEFARMPVTVAQAGQVLQNSLGQAILAIDNATGSTSSLAGAVVDLATILDSVTASMGGVNRETQKAGILQNGLATVFETVAVLAANTAFVLKSIGTELGAIGAQVGAVLRGDFAQAAEIGRLAKLDAEAARAQIDATTRNILNARQRAQDLKDVAGITDAQSRRMAVLNDTIKAGTKATSDNTKAKKAKREESVKVADAIREEERAMFALLEGEEKYRRLQDSRIEAADEMLRSIEFETQLLTLNTQERAIATAQRELERKGIVAGTEAYDEYIQKIRQAVINREATQESVDRIKEINDEGKRFAADLERGLTDSLFRAFEAGKGFFSTLWDGIKNLFKTTVLKLAIQGVVGGITGTAGSIASAASSAGGGGGLLGSLSNIGSLASLGGAFGSSLSAGFSASLSGGLSTLGLALEGGLASIATGTSTAIASGLGQIAGTLGPYALAAFAAVSILGSIFGSSKGATHFGGAYSSVSGQLTDSASVGSAFGISGGAVGDLVNRVNPEVNKSLMQLVASFTSASDNIKQVLGIDALRELTVGFAADASDKGKDSLGYFQLVNAIGEVIQYANRDLAKDPAQGFQQLTDDVANSVLEGLDKADIPAWADRILAGVGTTSGIQGLDAFTQQITAAVELQKSLQALPLAVLANVSVEASLALAQLSGGVEALAGNLDAYYNNFYSESERTANTLSALDQAFASLNLQTPTTREGFRALVDAQDVSTVAGQNTVAALLRLAGAFAEVIPAGASFVGTVDEATDAFTQAQQRVASANRDVASTLQALQQYGAGLQADVTDTLASINTLRGEAQQAVAAAEAARQQAQDAYNSSVQALANLVDQAGQTLVAAEQRVATARQAIVDRARADAQSTATALATAEARLSTIRQQATQQLDDARSQVASAQSALESALSSVAASVQAAADKVASTQSAVDAARNRIGTELAAAQDAYAAAQQRVIDSQQQATQSLAGFGDGINEFLRSLSTSDLGSTGPSLRAASGQFEALIARAQGGDAAAFGQATDAARTLLEVAKGQAGSFSEFQGIDIRVRQALGQLSAISAGSATEEENGADAALAAALANLERIQAIAQQAGVEAIRTTQDLLGDLNAALSDNQAAQAEYQALLAQTTGLNLGLAGGVNSLSGSLAAVAAAQADLSTANAALLAAQATVAAVGAEQDATQATLTSEFSAALVDVEAARAANTAALAVLESYGASVQAEQQTLGDLVAEYTDAQAALEAAQTAYADIVARVAESGIDVTLGNAVDAFTQGLAAVNANRAALDAADAALLVAREQAIAVEAEKFTADTTLVQQYQQLTATLAQQQAALDDFVGRTEALDFSPLDALDPLGDLLGQYADAVSELLGAQQSQAVANAQLGEALARQYFAQIKDFDNAAYLATGQALDVAGGATASQVDAVYQSLLGRNIESQQLASAIAGYIDAGQQTFAGLSADIRASAEFLARTYGVDVQGSFNTEVGRLTGTVPGFAVGTNYVPQDMLAQIHEGEAIVPKAYNPAAGGQSMQNTERLERLVEKLTTELNTALQAIAVNTRKVATFTDRVLAPENDAIAVRNVDDAPIEVNVVETV